MTNAILAKPGMSNLLGTALGARPSGVPPIILHQRIFGRILRWGAAQLQQRVATNRHAARGISAGGKCHSRIPSARTEFLRETGEDAVESLSDF